MTERENLLLALNGKQPQWVPVYGDAIYRFFSSVGGRVLDEETGIKTDAFGVKFMPSPEGYVPAHTVTREYRLTDIANWRDVMPTVDLDAVDWEAEAEAIRQAAGDKGLEFFAGWIWDELVYLMGDEEAFIALLSEPEDCADCLMGIADFYIGAMQRLCKYLKPDIIMLMDHLCTHKGPMISAEAYREVIKPADEKFYKAVHEIGALAEVHMDGDIHVFMPDLHEMGVKVIQPFQVFNDINKAKEEYGFIGIGGWDSYGRGNQADSTEEEVRASVRKAMDAYAPTSNYIFWESGITPAFKRTAELLKDEARSYGHQFYNK